VVEEKEYLEAQAEQAAALQTLSISHP